MVGRSLILEPRAVGRFGCSVLGSIRTPQAVVELHHYALHRGHDSDFAPKRSYLNMALTRRPEQTRASYAYSPAGGDRLMGEVIYVPAGTRLRTQWGDGQQRAICLQFETGESADRKGWTARELEASLDVRSSFVRDSLIRLAREIEQPGFESGLMAESICIQLGIDLGRYFRSKRVPEEIGNGRLSAKQLGRIVERLAMPGPSPTVAELAMELGMSTRHFFRMFRAATGTTLSAFAAETRVTRARQLLTERRMPIKLVSWQCGFETPAAFSTAFRRAVGCGPREFRRRTL